MDQTTKKEEITAEGIGKLWDELVKKASERRKERGFIVHGYCSTIEKAVSFDWSKENCCNNEDCTLSGPFIKAMRSCVNLKTNLINIKWTQIELKNYKKKLFILKA